MAYQFPKVPPAWRGQRFIVELQRCIPGSWGERTMLACGLIPTPMTDWDEIQPPDEPVGASFEWHCDQCIAREAGPDYDPDSTEEEVIPLHAMFPMYLRAFDQGDGMAAALWVGQCKCPVTYYAFPRRPVPLPLIKSAF